MPPLSCETDALWHILCCSFYHFPPLSARRFSKLTKATSNRPFCTQSWRKGSRIGHSQPTIPLRSEKDGDVLSKNSEFFFSGHHVELDASGQATDSAREGRTSQNVSERDNWRLGEESLKQKAGSLRIGSSSTSHIPYRYGSLCNDQKSTRNGASLDGSPIRPINPTSEARGFAARQGHHYGELNAEKLHEELWRTSTAADFPRLQEILRVLVYNRGEKPSRRHYQALLLVNTSPEHGSVAEVVRILLQMEEAGITLDSAAYHAVLKVRTERCTALGSANFRRFSRYTPTIFSGDTFWKNFANAGLLCLARAGMTSSWDYCVTSKSSRPLRYFRAPSKWRSRLSHGSMTC